MDAELFALTLEGAGLEEIALHFGYSRDLARQNRQRSRVRLAKVLEAYGLETVAGWYADVARGERVLPDARAREHFVRHYLAEREATYRHTHAKSPSSYQRKSWKQAAYRQWHLKIPTASQRERSQVLKAVAAD